MIDWTVDPKYAWMRHMPNDGVYRWPETNSTWWMGWNELNFRLRNFWSSKKWVEKDVDYLIRLNTYLGPCEWDGTPLNVTGSRGNWEEYADKPISDDGSLAAELEKRIEEEGGASKISSKLAREATWKSLFVNPFNVLGSIVTILVTAPPKFLGYAKGNTGAWWKSLRPTQKIIMKVVFAFFLFSGIVTLLPHAPGHEAFWQAYYQGGA